MRKEELEQYAQKATILCEVPAKQLHLNTDIGGALANNLVLSINELEDGTSVAAVKYIQRVLASRCNFVRIA